MVVGSIVMATLCYPEKNPLKFAKNGRNKNTSYQIKRPTY